MKLKNKRTGEIIDDGYVRETYDFQFDGQKHVLAVFKGNGHRPPEMVSGVYKSLAELNSEWEDAPEEPKVYWYIYADKPRREEYGDFLEENFKKVGNYFSSKEEAKQAVEKLKAWKRLKDKGFRFVKWFTRVDGGIQINMEYNEYDGIDLECRNDLDLLFTEEDGDV